MKCVNFPLCGYAHIFTFSTFSECCYCTSTGVLRVQDLTLLFCDDSSLFWRAKAALCVYPEDYNLLCSWKQKKDLATPIICSLFLTIKA